MHSNDSMSKSPQSSLIGLSTDLLFLIIDNIPPESHLKFALTCKRLATVSWNVLQRHKKAHDKFRVGSDLDPFTLPLLLRSAFGLGDPIPAWHLRSFEIWRDRDNWADWKTLELERESPESASVCAISDLRVQPEEATHYLEWFCQYVDESFDEEYDTGIEQVESGSDGLLKALLFAKCPRIRDLKFVTRSQSATSCLHWMRILISQWVLDKDISEYDSVSGSETMSDGYSYQNGVSDSEQGIGIETSDHSTSPTVLPSWPAGFLSLRHIGVGVKSGTWMDDDRDEPSTSLLAHFLRLPNIESIFFTGLLSNEEDLDWYNTDPDLNDLADEVIPARCSSVKHLFLDGCGELSGDFCKALFEAPRHLLSASFRYADVMSAWSPTGVVRALTAFQGHSLQSLMWYGYNDMILQGDHCNVAYPEKLAPLQALKNTSINIEDMELAVEHSDGEIQLWESIPEDLESLETLVVWEGAKTGSGSGVKLERLDQAIVKMVTDGRYKHLKVIHLDDVERVRHKPGNANVSFNGAIAAGLAAGIDVHTLSNTAPMLHSIDYPEGPDEYDLRTGLYPGGRPSDWMFDPYLGRRVPPRVT